MATEDAGASGARAGRRLTWKGKLALVVLPSLLLLVGLEVAARVYAYVNYGSQTQGMNWRFEYEPFLQTRTDDRLDGPFPPKGDAFRILVIGGSTAALLPDEAVANAFRDQFGREAEVINLGQGSWVANQERIALLMIGLDLEPDLLLTLDGANDLVTATKTLEPGIPYSNGFIRLGVEKPVVNGLLGLVRNSQFINSLNKLRERSVERDARANPELLDETFQHFRSALGTMSLMARGAEIPHVMVIQPYLFLREVRAESEEGVGAAFAYRSGFVADGLRAFRNRLPASVDSTEVFFVDATHPFDDIPEASFIDEVHLTDDGYVRLARFIWQRAAEAGLDVRDRGETGYSRLTPSISR
jgi:hypothetical protein